MGPWVVPQKIRSLQDEQAAVCWYNHNCWVFQKKIMRERCPFLTNSKYLDCSMQMNLIITIYRFRPVLFCKAQIMDSHWRVCVLYKSVGLQSMESLLIKVVFLAKVLDFSGHCSPICLYLLVDQPATGHCFE